VTKKFRAWIEEEKKFIYPTHLTIFDTVCYVYDENGDQWQIKPEDLHQWTTLLDKNGKKIYESDFVCSQYPKHRHKYPCSGLKRSPNLFHRTVKYDEDYAWFDLPRDEDAILLPVEIIGNNKESPELL
jgi:hypothetical protein